MSQSNLHRIAILGNHVPRRCGIATFTADLAQSVSKAMDNTEVHVYAMDDGRECVYPPSVRGTVPADEIGAYRELAQALNDGDYDLLCVQHEFGIFGGPCGAHLLELLRNVKMPIVTTLHTILREPSQSQREVFEELLQLSEQLVVMSRKGEQILQEVYRVPKRRISVIPHGIRDTDPELGLHLRESLGIGNRPLVLTFGLLSPDKGIQDMVAAMPSIAARHPDVVYCVVGATHPRIVENHGEAHRDFLVSISRGLGVEENVKFIDRFVTDEELAGWLAAADIYVTPYLKPEQVVSGTLAYALGGGNAVVSTPYWYAEELLGEDRGLLVPFHDPLALSVAMNRLLDDPQLRAELSTKGFQFGREMKWPRVGGAYAAAFRAAKVESFGQLRLIAASDQVPGVAPQGMPSLEHLLALTDDTGIAQHATHRFPNRNEGYCTDDNARALELSLTARTFVDADVVDALADRYLAFVIHSFDPESAKFCNFMSYARTWIDVGSDDCQGRVLRALSTAVATDDEDLSTVARDYFLRALPEIAKATSPRAWASTLVGCVRYASAHDDPYVLSVAQDLAERLSRLYMTVRRDDWCWFEESLTYENALLSQALIEAGRLLRAPDLLVNGLESLIWLMEQQTSRNGCFAPIGSNGFYKRGGARAWYDQQPVEAAATVSACLSAARATFDMRWEEEAGRAYRWFIGDNTEGLAIADPSSGRCNDGLHSGRTNQNSGAESTIAYLQASVELVGVSTISNRARLA